jgi:4-hydroxy-3-methylbut-2-enyl diphosphate reductase
MSGDQFVFAKSRRGSDLRGSRVQGRALTVVAADDMGMCFGVQDALKLLDTVEKPDGVTIYGELVHNQRVLENLSTRGFKMLPEEDRALEKATDTVLVTAHGISERERGRLTGAGKTLMDTTCPLVLKVHEAAQQLEAAGYFVVVIGRRDHVEVKGILEDLKRYASSR